MFLHLNAKIIPIIEKIAKKSEFMYFDISIIGAKKRIA